MGNARNFRNQWSAILFMIRQFFAYYRPYRGLFFLDFGCAFVIDLPELGGRKRLEAMGIPVHALTEFDGA